MMYAKDRILAELDSATAQLASLAADLKANPNRRAVGTIVEAQLDKAKGPLATVLPDLPPGIRPQLGPIASIMGVASSPR